MMPSIHPSLVSTILPRRDLMKQLKHESQHVQLAGRQALSSQRPSDTELEEVIELSQREGDEGTRAHATSILGQIYNTWSECSEKISPNLVLRLLDSSREVIDTAARALTEKILHAPSSPDKIIRDIIRIL